MRKLVDWHNNRAVTPLPLAATFDFPAAYVPHEARDNDEGGPRTASPSRSRCGGWSTGTTTGPSTRSPSPRPSTSQTRMSAPEARAKDEGGPSSSPLAHVEEVGNAHEEQQGRRAGGGEDITQTIAGTLSPVGGG